MKMILAIVTLSAAGAQGQPLWMSILSLPFLRRRLKAGIFLPEHQHTDLGCRRRRSAGPKLTFPSVFRVP